MPDDFSASTTKKPTTTTTTERPTTTRTTKRPTTTTERTTTTSALDPKRVYVTTPDPSDVPEYRKRFEIAEISNHENIRLINNEKCGLSPKKRILGGTVAEPGDFPWM